MKAQITKAVSATALSLALVAATTQANAGSHNIFGAAFFGALAGGLVAGAIQRCHNHGMGLSHCHAHNGGHQHYATGIVYVQPAPVIVQPAPQVVVTPGAYSQQHYNWCIANYNSYHAPSNTFQPYNGPRRPCISPWGG